MELKSRHDSEQSCLGAEAIPERIGYQRVKGMQPQSEHPGRHGKSIRRLIRYRTQRATGAEKFYAGNRICVRLDQYRKGRFESHVGPGNLRNQNRRKAGILKSDRARNPSLSQNASAFIAHQSKLVKPVGKLGRIQREIHRQRTHARADV